MSGTGRTHGREGDGATETGDGADAPASGAKRTDAGTESSAAGGRYPPIGDYAVVGDCHGTALISREGRVDWCCLGRFDSMPIFHRLLDADRGGYLALRPVAPFETERRYLPATNILETTFRTEEGAVRLLDFMPVGRQPGSGVHDYVTLAAPFWLVRIVKGLEGRVSMQAEYRPTPDFGRERPELGPDTARRPARGLRRRVHRDRHRGRALPPRRARLDGGRRSRLGRVRAGSWRP